MLNTTSYLSSISPKGTLPLPSLGFFNRDHLNYEIDRQRLPKSEAEPSLSDMTKIALNTLHTATAKQNAKGFFLMIEGSRIDMAVSAETVSQPRPMAIRQRLVSFEI